MRQAFQISALAAAALFAGACFFDGGQVAEPLTTPPAPPAAQSPISAAGEPWATPGTLARLGPLTQTDIDRAIGLLEVLSRTASGADPEEVMQKAGFPPGRGVYATSRLSLIYNGLASGAAPAAAFQAAGSPPSEYPTEAEIELVKKNQAAIAQAQAAHAPGRP